MVSFQEVIVRQPRKVQRKILKKLEGILEEAKSTKGIVFPFKTEIDLYSPLDGAKTRPVKVHNNHVRDEIDKKHVILSA